MEVWIPEKWEIENLLESVHLKLKYAEKVSDVSEWAEDQLELIQCHINNRANLDRHIN
jgi:hypothetical protein